MQNERVFQTGPIVSNKRRVSLPEPFRTWSGETRPYPRHLAIAQIFEEIVEKFPSAVALAYRGARISYAQLNRRANHLAGELIGRGVGRDVLVGICFERSPEMIVAMLAILKAGGAYLPIDPSLPAARIELLLRDTKVRLVLTQEQLAETVLAKQDVQPVIEDEATLASRHTGANPGGRASATDLAYVMYTSGSRGVPKGVMVEQKSITRLVRNTNYSRFGPTDVFLQAAPVSFDASTFEIWGALLNGGCLALLPPETTSLEELGAAILENDVTTLWLTSGLFHLMAEQRLADLRNVRQLLTGGDVVSPVWAREVLENLPDCQLINGYGPTENTTFTCCHRMSHGDAIAESVPIGRPISNTQVFLLDADLNPVGVGAAGEIYAAGEGLARGYLNDSLLTAERFVENPFGARGERMYRTGDIGSWRADGTLEFVGRLDDQIKILGHRVEPAEVEASLRTHPEILQTHVSAEASSTGGKRLVAYYVPASRALPESALRSFLNEKLPAYMHPSAFFPVASFPLTINGKIDRDALQASRSKLSRVIRLEVVSPGAHKIESMIRTIWSELLCTKDVPLDANFFDMGGNSLLLFALHAKLEATLNCKLPIVDLFEFTTIRKLAKHVTGMLQRTMRAGRGAREEDEALSAVPSRVEGLGSAR